jgi:hydroxymethylpyrimidine kinase/phosphomethylpyrimidine kinase
VRIPCALTIAGSDSGGGAGIQGDLKTFASLGVHGLSVVTAVTAQNTQRVEGTFELPPEFVRKQLDAVTRDFDVEWAKTGMLSSADIIRKVEAGAKRHRLRLVVDPVMVAASGGQLLRDDALDQLRRLLKRAELVTPNIPEAQRLAGMKIRSAKDARNAARKISKLGPKAVLIKGGHLPRRDILDLLLVGGKFREFKGPRVTSEPVHGTGCSFSAAITAELAKGAELTEAVHNAREFIVEAIEGRLKVGRGLSPVNPLASLEAEVEEVKALREVWTGAQLLVNEPKFSDLLPEVGSNLVMALPGARERSEVIGLSGRIVRVGNCPHLAGFPTRGGSEHVANIVLTAMRHDPEVRAGMNIRFSDDVLKKCRRLGLSVSSFDRRKEPRGAKTMRWGTELAIKSAGGVPDVIFDRGARGKEPMIRLLGQTATEIAERALELAKDLRR